MKTIKDFDVEGKRVLVRLDINVPVSATGEVEDDFRLRESLFTIKYLVEHKAKCIIIGHLGRPDAIFENFSGAVASSESLQSVAQRIAELLAREVLFIPEPIGKSVEDKIAHMALGDVAVLENIRFYRGEKENDSEFAKKLAQLADIYINDAFAVDHRAHASLVGINAFLPSGMGLLLEKEIAALQKIVQNPETPMVVVVGGTKVETKGGFLDEMSQIADSILTGNPVHNEITEKGLEFAGSEKIVAPPDGIPNIQNALDIGPETIKLFEEKIADAKTIFWTGPLGKIEEEPYDIGSKAIAEAIIKSGAFSVAGGGDLVAFLREHGYAEKFNHISTGGGALLAFLAGEELPGLEALKSQNE